MGTKDKEKQGGGNRRAKIREKMEKHVKTKRDTKRYHLQKDGRTLEETGPAKSKVK